MALADQLPGINQEFADHLEWQVGPLHASLARLTAVTLAFADIDPDRDPHRDWELRKPNNETVQAGTEVLRYALEVGAQNQRSPLNKGSQVGLAAMRRLVARSVHGLGGEVVDAQNPDHNPWSPLPLPSSSEDYMNKDTDLAPLNRLLDEGLDRVMTFSGESTARLGLLFPPALRRQVRVRAVLEDAATDSERSAIAPFRTWYNLMATEETLPLLERHEARDELGICWEREGVTNVPEAGAARVIVATYVSRLATNLGGLVRPAPETSRG